MKTRSSSLSLTISSSETTNENDITKNASSSLPISPGGNANFGTQDNVSSLTTPVKRKPGRPPRTPKEPHAQVRPILDHTDFPQSKKSNSEFKDDKQTPNVLTPIKVEPIMSVTCGETESNSVTVNLGENIFTPKKLKLKGLDVQNILDPLDSVHRHTRSHSQSITMASKKSQNNAVASTSTSCFNQNKRKRSQRLVFQNRDGDGQRRKKQKVKPSQVNEPKLLGMKTIGEPQRYYTSRGNDGHREFQIDEMNFDNLCSDIKSQYTLPKGWSFSGILNVPGPPHGLKLMSVMELGVNFIGNTIIQRIVQIYNTRVFKVLIGGVDITNKFGVEFNNDDDNLCRFINFFTKVKRTKMCKGIRRARPGDSLKYPAIVQREDGLWYSSKCQVICRYGNFCCSCIDLQIKGIRTPADTEQTMELNLQLSKSKLGKNIFNSLDKVMMDEHKEIEKKFKESLESGKAENSVKTKKPKSQSKPTHKASNQVPSTSSSNMNHEPDQSNGPSTSTQSLVPQEILDFLNAQGVTVSTVQIQEIKIHNDPPPPPPTNQNDIIEIFPSNSIDSSGLRIFEVDDQTLADIESQVLHLEGMYIVPDFWSGI